MQEKILTLIILNIVLRFDNQNIFRQGKKDNFLASVESKHKLSY